MNPAAVGDAAGEWIELYNPNSRPVHLLGWTLSDGGAEHHTLQADAWLPPLGYAVLARNAETSANGGVAAIYRYSGINLGNGDDSLILLAPDGREMDRVTWGGTSGAARARGASLERLAGGAGWQVAVSVWPGSAGDRGSPGLPNVYGRHTDPGGERYADPDRESACCHSWGQPHPRRLAAGFQPERPADR